MSNIFLSTSFIYLASVDVGCQMNVMTTTTEEDNGDNNPINDNNNGCNQNVYGMTPASLIANIAIVSGLLSAFLMPLSGAMIDYTPYRREVGILSAFFMIAIQAIQIGTVQATWFPMAILQAIAGFLYQVQVLATFAYLPEIARSVGQTKLTYCT
jgi:MFS-type transporter involved in bile tolerance (Atg22 family)